MEHILTDEEFNECMDLVGTMIYKFQESLNESSLPNPVKVLAAEIFKQNLTKTVVTQE